MASFFSSRTLTGRLAVVSLLTLAACDGGSKDDTGSGDSAGDDTGSTGDDTGTPASDCDDSGEVIIHDGETISEDVTWSGQHVIQNGLIVEAELTLAPCARIAVEDGGIISVQEGGSIQSIGTEADPVVWTSAKEAPAAGDWSRFDLYASASPSRFEWTVLEHGGSGYYGMAWMQSGARASFENVTVRHAPALGLSFDNGAEVEAFEAVTFEQIGSHALMLGANAVGSLTSLQGTDVGEGTILVRHEEVSRTATWRKLGLPYELEGVYFTAPVTLEPGVELRMQPDALIEIQDEGSLRAVGTEQAPILITSAKDSPDAGDWNRIDIFGSSSGDNHFAHVTLEYGGSGYYGMVWMQSGAEAAFEDVTVRHAPTLGLSFDNGAEVEAFEDVTFEDIGSHALVLGANAVGSLTSLQGTDVGEGAILVRAEEVSEPAQWRKLGLPYEVGGFWLEAELDIAPGVELRVQPDALIYVQDGGSFRSVGTEEAPIRITSSKSAPDAGDWVRLDFYGTSAGDNRLEWTTLEYSGGSGTYGGVWLQDGAKLTLDHATLQHNERCDIHVGARATLVATDSTYVTCPR